MYTSLTEVVCVHSKMRNWSPYPSWSNSESTVTWEFIPWHSSGFPSLFFFLSLVVFQISFNLFWSCNEEFAVQSSWRAHCLTSTYLAHGASRAPPQCWVCCECPCTTLLSHVRIDSRSPDFVLLWNIVSSIFLNVFFQGLIAITFDLLNLDNFTFRTAGLTLHSRWNKALCFLVSSSTCRCLCLSVLITPSCLYDHLMRFVFCGSLFQ